MEFELQLHFTGVSEQFMDGLLALALIAAQVVGGRVDGGFAEEPKDPMPEPLELEEDNGEA